MRSTAIDPFETKWQAWRPHDVAQLLAGVRVPWYVAAGWALELFGDQVLPHFRP